MAANEKQKFFEIIKPGSTFEFIGMQKYWIGLSIVLVAVTLMIGIAANLFTSVWLSRSMFDFIVGRKAQTSLSI